jgi:hypothetical protein
MASYSTLSLNYKNQFGFLINPHLLNIFPVIVATGLADVRVTNPDGPYVTLANGNTI